MHVNPTYQGASFLFTASFLYGLYGIYSRMIGDSFGPFYTIGVRAVIMLAIQALYFLISRRWKTINKKDYKWFAIMILPGWAAIVAVFLAFNRIAIGTVYFALNASCVLFSYLIGQMFFAEKITPVKIVSLVFCLLGLFFIYKNSIAGGGALYIILTIAAGLGSVIWNIFSKKVTSHYPLFQVLTVDSAVTVLCAIPVIWLLGETASRPSLSLPWIAVTIFALTCLLVSTLTIAGFRLIEAQKGSLIMMLEPVFGTLLAFWIFHESVTPLFAWGAGLILIGMCLPIIKTR